MPNPLAYGSVGFIDDGTGKFYNVIQSDDPNSNLYYVVPSQFRTSRKSDGTLDISIAVCEDFDVPSIDANCLVEPFIDATTLQKIKERFGSNLAPLPLCAAGRISIYMGDFAARGISVDTYSESKLKEQVDGITDEEKALLSVAERRWLRYGVQPPLSYFLQNPKDGVVISFPTSTGSNLGAKIPFAFIARGKEKVASLKKQLNQSGSFGFDIAYSYKGTMTPFKLQVIADLSKVHEFMAARFTTGRWFWKAEVYAAVEKLREERIIDVKIYDLNDKEQYDYDWEKLFDLILEKVLNFAFEKSPDIKPNTEPPKESQRFWWNSWGFKFKSDKRVWESFLNIRIVIEAASKPIPITVSGKIDSPPITDTTCLGSSYREEIYGIEFQKILQELPPEDRIKLLGTFSENLVSTFNLKDKFKESVLFKGI